MQVFKAPELYPKDGIKIFLAGSIDMGNAEDWQSEFTKKVEDTNLIILNPRRDDWDSTWVQSYENVQFKEQVEWELAALSDADIIVMYFDPKGQSPISLLELGLFHKRPIVVCCPDGYWKQGNVEVVCKWFGVEFTKDKELFFNRIIELCKTL